MSVEKDFAVSQTLRPSLKNFQEIIKVGHIYATADYMVLQMLLIFICWAMHVLVGSMNTMWSITWCITKP